MFETTSIGTLLNGIVPFLETKTFEREVRRERHNVHILLREVSREKERYSCKK